MVHVWPVEAATHMITGTDTCWCKPSVEVHGSLFLVVHVRSGSSLPA